MRKKQFVSAVGAGGENQGRMVWEKAMGAIPGTMQVHPLPSAPFFAEATHGLLGHATLCQLHAGPQRAEPVRRANSGCSGMIQLVFVVDGILLLEQGNRRVELGSDEWALCETDKTCFTITEASATLLLMTVPQTMLGAHCRDMIRMGLRALCAATGAGKLVRQMVQALFDELEDLQPAAAAELTAMTLELAHMAIRQSARCDHSISVRDMLAERMSAFIRRSLRDPDLSVDRVATAFACSKRYVHKIFSSQAETVGELILHARLDNCRRDLADGALAGQSITGIAFSWGFSNSAHFSRVFRERYGVSPSAYRAQQAATTPATSREFKHYAALEQPVVRLRESALPAL